jgi:hypothetical protein
MTPVKETIKSVWSEIEPVVELFVYLFIARAISFLFGISYLQSITIVYLYFVLNLARIGAEILRNKFR